MFTVNNFKEMLSIENSEHDDLILRITNVLNLFPTLNVKSSTYATKREITKNVEDISMRTQDDNFLCDIDLLNFKTIYELNVTDVSNDFNINILNSSSMKNGEVAEFTVTYTGTDKVANGYNLNDGTNTLNTQEFTSSFIIGNYVELCRIKQKITVIRRTDGSFNVYNERMFSTV